MIAVSIVIPIYNVEKYLRRCLDSVIKQNTDLEYEIICINDGSKDACAEILSEYAKLYKNLKVIHKENTGLSDTRNIGVDLAQGEYIMFVDSDDFISENTIEEVYKYAKAHNSDVLIFDFARYIENIHGYQINTFPNICNRYRENSFNVETADSFVYRFVPVSAWAKLYKRELIKDIKFEKGLHYEDVPYWSLVYTSAKRVNYLNKFFYFYTLNRQDAIMSNKDERIFDVFKAFELAADTLKSRGYFEKFKNIHYAHFASNLVNYIHIINADLRQELIDRIKSCEFDLDYNKFFEEDFFPMEKREMIIIKFIRENNYENICAYLKENGLW